MIRDVSWWFVIWFVVRGGVVHKKVIIRSRYGIIHKKVTIRSRYGVVHKKVTIRSRQCHS